MHALRPVALVVGAVAFVAGPVVLALVPHDIGAVAWYATGLVGLAALLVGASGRAPGWVPAVGLYAGAVVAVPLAYGVPPGSALGYALLLPVAPAVGILVGPPAWALMAAGVIAALLVWRRHADAASPA